MIPPLDEWEEDRPPRGCALILAASVALWAVIIGLARFFWPG